MDQETREYLERMLLGLTTKEDLEKLRQETKSNFRQLKEENKNQILEWKQEVKADLEQLRKGEVGQTDPMRKEFRDGFQDLKVETQSVLNQSIQKIETLLQEIKDERETPFVRQPARSRHRCECIKGWDREPEGGNQGGHRGDPLHQREDERRFC